MKDDEFSDFENHSKLWGKLWGTLASNIAGACKFYPVFPHSGEGRTCEIAILVWKYTAKVCGHQAIFGYKHPFPKVGQPFAVISVLTLLERIFL